MLCLWGAGAAVCWALAGCQSPPASQPADRLTEANELHLALFGDFDLPRKIGTVENVHLQLPVFSPDGNQLMYLRTDCEHLSPMTMLGSPEHTPPDGSLSIWIRPTEGNSPGRCLSTERWAHSAVWSNNGRSVLYVANEPPGSCIVHLDLVTGEVHRLGAAGQINCLPRFTTCDDETVVFCVGKDPKGPFRVARQSLREATPVFVSPEGMDCLMPTQAGCGTQLLCARSAGERLNWATCSPDGTTDVGINVGSSRRPEVLTAWAGIADPLSPDGSSLMCYDPLQDRICIFHKTDRRIVRHRPGSIAACWLTENAVALATDRAVFAVNTATGFSPSLFDGIWIPARYVPAGRRLLLLGRDNAARFSIVEVIFKTSAPVKRG